MGNLETDQPMGVFEDFGPSAFKKQKESPEEVQDNATKAMANAVEKRNSFINDLAGDGGVIVKTVLDNLSDRVQFLIDQDPECQAYKKVLGDIYKGLQFPQKVAKRLAKLFEIEGAPKM